MEIPNLSDIHEGLVHLFYPTLCEGCNRPLISGEIVLCLECEDMLPLTNYHAQNNNETTLRLAGRVPFVRASSFAFFTEDSLLQHLMHGLKYKGKKNIGTYLGTQLAQSLNTTDWLSDINVIIPVPLHPSKEALRGFNQSTVIAKAIGKSTGIPISDQILIRTRETDSQTKKTRSERTANMQGAFSLSEATSLNGKHILLLDDVLTTGATIEACAAAFSAIPDLKISVVTIGIAVS